MSDFISGLQQKVNDTSNSITNKFQDTVQGNDAPSSNDSQPHQNVGQGMKEASAGYRSFTKQREQDKQHAQEPEQPGKKGTFKKMGRFLKSAFSYGSAARKEEHAAEDVTGKNLKDLNPFSQPSTS